MRRKIFVFTIVVTLICFAFSWPAQAALTSDEQVGSLRYSTKDNPNKTVTVTLTWETPAVITKKMKQYLGGYYRLEEYRVERAILEPGNEINYDSRFRYLASTTKNSFEDKNLARGKNYFYRVYAAYVGHLGPSSDVVKVYAASDKTAVQVDKRFLTREEEKALLGQGSEGAKKVEQARQEIQATEKRDPNAMPKFLKDFFKVIYAVAPGLAIAAIIFAGFRYVTSQGDPEAIKLAKEIIFGALSGLVLLILAKCFFNILIGEVPYNLLP